MKTGKYYLRFFFYYSKTFRIYKHWEMITTKEKTTCYYETIAIFIRPGIRRKNLRNLLELDNIGYNFI